MQDFASESSIRGPDPRQGPCRDAAFINSGSESSGSPGLLCQKRGTDHFRQSAGETIQGSSLTMAFAPSLQRGQFCSAASAPRASQLQGS
jgi:hypothetical protein